MSTAPAMPHHTSDTRGHAVIGKSVMIKGQIFSREDLTIDGEIDGSVELQEHRLTVGPHGKVQAGVKQMLLAIVLLDATLVYWASGDALLAFCTALLIVPATTLGRFIFIT